MITLPALIDLTVVLLLLYTMLRPGTMSPIGFALWSILAFTIIKIWYKNKFKFIFSRAVPLFLYGIVLCLHFTYTKDSWLSAFMYYVIFILLFSLVYDKQRNYRSLYMALILITIIQTVVFVPQLITALVAQNEVLAFKGLFENSNTCSIFSACTYVVSFLFVRKKPLKFFFMLICLIGVVGGMSRNAIIFIILFHVFSYLIKKYHCGKLLLCALPFILILVARILIFTDTSSSLSLFGKSGTTGRADQLVYLAEFYSLNLFGNGREVIADNVQFFYGVPPHNLYFFTAYGMGLLYLLTYFIFIIWLFTKLKTPTAKSFLLALHVYYFFEPIIPFEASMSFFLPTLLIIIIDKSLETPKLSPICH